MQRAVFLDRDGVINRALVRDGKPYPPANLAAVEILPGVSDALSALHDADFMLIVVTNQPDVARGTTPLATVEEINNHLANCLPIDEVGEEGGQTSPGFASIRGGGRHSLPDDFGSA